jgi:hypothetical protein
MVGSYVPSDASFTLGGVSGTTPLIPAEQMDALSFLGLNPPDLAFKYPMSGAEVNLHTRS